MATHSSISVLREDGTVISTHCTFDGYLNGVGKELITYFTKLDKAEGLVLEGELRGINKGEVEPYNRLEGKHNHTEYESFGEFYAHYEETSYDYIFVESKNSWFLMIGDDSFITLSTESLFNQDEILEKVA